MQWRFGPFRLDTASASLWHDAQRLPVRPKAFDVLVYLVSHAGELVTKAALLEAVWPEAVVGDAVLKVRIRELRQLLGESTQSATYIETVPRRGYRFIAPVCQRPLPAEQPALLSTVAPAPAAITHTGEPSALTLGPALPEVHGAVSQGDRKLVTVLHIALDTVAWNSEPLGLDTLHTRMRVLYDAVQEAVSPYDGIVQHVASDHILAVFGIPVAQEDHAHRAVFAALTLQRWAEALRQAPRSTTEARLAVRVSVHTGYVAVGGIGNAQTPTPTVVGDTLLRAATLHSYTAAGTIVCSETTARLVQDIVQLAPLPASQTGQYTGAINAYAIVGQRPPPTVGGSHGRRVFSHFVGRTQELTSLFDLLAQVEEGQGQVVGIVGEPGMGKSRLLYEFHHRLRARHPSVTYVEGQCMSYGQATPYLPVRTILQQLCGLTFGDGPEVITAKVHQCLQAVELAAPAEALYLLHLLEVEGDMDVLAQQTPHTIKARTFEALQQMCCQRPRRQPLVVAIENVHWIDATSAEFLTALVEGVAGSALLVLLTYRPGYHASWIDKSYATQLSLRRLSRQESLAIVDAVLSTARLPIRLLETLLEKAAGNPFFLEELARSLVERETPVASLPVPNTIHAVLAARIDRLPPPQRQLLQTAAVLGMEVPATLVHRVTALSEEELHTHLRALQAAEFLYETRRVPELAYTFKHVLTQEVAYGSLLPERRRALHAQIVETIEQLPPDCLTDQVERLALHAVRGTVWDKAVSYCRLAGAKAAGRSALREAAAAFEQALEALQHLPDCDATRALAIDLRFDLRNALHPLGEHEQILDHLRQAEPLAEALGDRRRLGQLAVYMAACLRLLGDPDGSLAAAQRVLALAESLGDIGLQVVANACLGELYLYTLNDYLQGAKAFSRNVEILHGPLLREHFGGSLVQSVNSRACLAVCLAELGAFAEGWVHSEEALRLAEGVEHPYSLAQACATVGHFYLRQGALPQALRVVERGLVLSDTVHLPVTIYRCNVLLGIAYALSERVPEALPLLEQALEQTVTMRATTLYPLYAVWIAEGYMLAGRAAQARPLGQHALEAARAQKQPGYQAYALRLLGEMAAQGEASDVEVAATHYRQALTLAAALGMRPLQAHCHRGLGMLYAEMGQWEQAHTALSTAIALYRAMEMIFWIPPTEANLDLIQH